MRSSKDIARRLRLRGYPRPDAFRRRYFAAGVVAAALAASVWLLLETTIGNRQYLPRPVSSNHALFGERCESCHDSFRAVADAACLGCHSLRTHATNETVTPRCGHCHAEHRDTDTFLSVSELACVECHADLKTDGKAATIETKIGSFDAHPEFVPLREATRGKDPGQLRFNHHKHLTSTQIPEDKGPLVCQSCHRLGGEGRWMEPIQYENHCQRCHQQVVEGPVGSIEVVHEEPAVIREKLRLALLDAAASIGTATSAELRRQLESLSVPSPELLSPTQLPGRVARPGFDAARLSVLRLEQDLYAPFVEADAAAGESATSRYDLNKGCYLCHLGQGSGEENTLARIDATKIPERWLLRSEFSHRHHELMPCEDCHTSLRDSRATADTNLPEKSACQRCHVEGETASAGTSCTTCHLYHDTSRAKPRVADADDSAPEQRGPEVQLRCPGGGTCAGEEPRPARLAPLLPQRWWETPPTDSTLR